MKKLLAFVLLAALFTSCDKKKDDPAPATTNSTNTNTNSMNGDWKVNVYDNTPVTAPMAATYKATASSATGGTVHFDITFDGTQHHTEDCTYTLSSGNTKVDFTKTGGDYTVLSGGKTWTITKLDATALEMTSGFGLVMKMSK